MTTNPHELDEAQLQQHELMQKLGEARRELEEARRDLAQAMQLRDEFMSIVSHELRTPLNTMKLELYARRIYLENGDRDAFTPNKLTAMIDSDERQLDRLMRMINDMSDVSRIQTGFLSLRISEVDLAVLVQGLIVRFEAQIKQASCTVRLHISGDVNARVDEFRIEQAFVNVLTNALRHGKGELIDIYLDDMGDNVRIEVRDCGPGIQPADQQRIFQRFERGSHERKGGLGLGLFIANQIVTAHRGQLSVSSIPGEGASFFLLLPKSL